MDEIVNDSITPPVLGIQQHSWTLSRILRPLKKKQGGHWLNISRDSTTMQAPGFYFCYKMLQICSAYSPPFFEKNRGSIRGTFRATPPPFKSWAPTPPVTPASDLSIWSWAFGPASFLMRNYACFWTWMLGDGICHSAALDLSIWSWAFGPASFLITN